MQPPDLQPPRFLTWLVFIALIFAALLLALLLPFAPLAGVILAGLMGAILLVAWRSKLGLRHLAATALRGRKVALFGHSLEADDERMAIRPRVVAAEIALIVAAALVVTSRGYYLDQTGHRLRGYEAEFLTNSAYFASASLREYGYIPKWQPWLEFGEPLIHNPFSFIINPFSSAPSLLLDGQRGILVSVVIYAILAGIGGWFLGWILGCASPARLLLALLVLGKGNMQAMIGSGFFQLGVSQAYFPWIIAGTMAIFRLPGKRWPIVLTALACALMFLAGNIWYTLPMLACVALLGLHYGVLVKLDTAALKRLALAGALTLGLSAVTLLPIWLEHDHIEHPNVDAAGDATPLNQIIPLYFDSDVNRRIQIFNNPSDPTQGYEIPVLGVALTYYSYVVPLWFATLVFVLIPPIPSRLHRAGHTGLRGIWVVGALIIVLCTLWGAGGNPLFIWLYQHIPLLRQWGYVGRALAVASFWIALLIALRVDGIWRVLNPPALLNGKTSRRGAMKLILGAALVAACAAAAYNVNRQWGFFPVFEPPSYRDGTCVTWLRAHNPGEQLAVWRGGYDAIFTYLDNHVRKFNVEVAYTPLPLPSSIGSLDLLGDSSLPEYAIPWRDNEREWLSTHGYVPVPGSQLLDSNFCLWRNASALPYAYTVPLKAAAKIRGDQVDAARISPVTALERRPDEIALIASSDADRLLVLTVQERAYPGWQVELDGRLAVLEVFGGQIAVLLPPDGRPHAAHFIFRPSLFYLGAAVTLFTCVVCALMLLPVTLCRR